jgi:hypothetical protein
VVHALDTQDSSYDRNHDKGSAKIGDGGRTSAAPDAISRTLLQPRQGA